MIKIQKDVKKIVVMFCKVMNPHACVIHVFTDLRYGYQFTHLILDKKEKKVSNCSFKFRFVISTCADLTNREGLTRTEIWFMTLGKLSQPNSFCDNVQKTPVYNIWKYLKCNLQTLNFTRLH